MVCSFFFFNDTATTEIYTLSLHDALPISTRGICRFVHSVHRGVIEGIPEGGKGHSGGRKTQDRKSTRLNSSHSQISYAVFCLKKKKQHTRRIHRFSGVASVHCV